MVEEIANLIREATGEEAKITVPEDPKFGHYSTNLPFAVAKYQETDSISAAKELKDKIYNYAPNGFFEHIDIVGGFLNFFLGEGTLEREFEKILREKGKYGAFSSGRGKTIVIDYSAPNIAKPMNIGHLRSTIIGQALVNLYRFLGYRVIGDNHLGDWGTQFGALIGAYKKWGDKKEFEARPIDHLVSLYIRFHKEAENSEELAREAREETRKLQEGDKENRRLWKLFVKESLKEFNKIYRRLGIKFNVALGESFYQPMLKKIVDEALARGVAKKDGGAVKISFENLPDFVIRKSDGSFLYTTTDLATIKYRVGRWRPKKILYVVANEQTLHFSQLFSAVSKLAYAPQVELVHVKFGMVLGESGKKMSTRRGEFIRLEEVLDKAAEKAGEINKAAAEEVGIGAVKYNILSHDRMSDIVFDWDKMLDLRGNSGPYLQYAYARARSVLRKAGKFARRPDISLFRSESEKTLLRQTIYFPDAVFYAAENYAVNHLTDYLYKLAGAMNHFYEKEPILKAEKNVRQARLALLSGASEILKKGLTLLGIKAAERM
jgi:arginyl-tRNA synthetase